MPVDVKRLRIFVASPSDVADERQRLARVVKAMNRTGGPAERLGLTLELLGWETHVAPDAGRPQGVVFGQLPPEDWDIFVGILWLRFGSDTGEIDPDTGQPYRSGTEEEFKAAYRRRQVSTTDWPKVMFYRCIRPPADILHLDTIQLASVQQFFNDFRPGGPHPGLVQPYTQPEEFERLIRDQLEKFVWEYADLHGLSRSMKVSSPSQAQVTPKVDMRQAFESYLRHLIDRFRYLDFRGMGISDRVPLRLSLVEMYVPLKARIELPEGETWARELRLAGRKVSKEEAETIGRRLSEPQPVLNLLRQNDGLIILGDPGAGKTTFLKYLTLRLASDEGEALGLGARLPALLPLSAYANVLVTRDVPLDHFIAEYYRDRGIDLPIGPMLDEALAKGEMLLLLDGLDEVKDLAQRHLVIRRVIDFFTFQRQKGNKFILTSRIVGYREVRPVAEGLAECTLADFEDEDIVEFVGKWTSALERAARGDTPVATQEAAREREELLEAVRRNPGVKKLAANPLLLTILALMKRQGVVLPERRVELYQKYVETLLKYWNLARGLDRPPSRDLDVVETVRVLAPLALWMHETSPGVGLVKREKVQRKLEEIYASRGLPNPEAAARQLLFDVHDYASLLLERGLGEYGFIHLTFQEYLAAVAIALRGQQKVNPIVDALAEHVGDDSWHEVVLLTIGYMGIVQQRDEAAGATLLELIKKAPKEPGQVVVLAGEAVIDAWPGGVTPTCKEAIVQSLQETMVDDVRVKAPLRAAAGRALAKFGDPRPEVMTLEGMQFCLVPAGTFLMGGEEGERERPNKCLNYAYWMSLYPVTNAQFQAFIEAGGYRERRYWKEAEAAGCWHNGKIRRRYTWFTKESEVKDFEEEADRPKDFDEPFNLSNHPVVGVTWYEALAFTRWLTERLQGVISDGHEVRLPSEAEWEKAAKGGIQILKNKCLMVKGRVDAGREMVKNLHPLRRYPWGNEPDPNLANYSQTGIITTSAVGCFPKGVSPYGAEELSGNVWERTRSLWGKDWGKPDFKYPYDPKDGREDLKAGNDVLRVLRGGAFSYGEWGVRCAFRGRDAPDYRFRLIGFRVVLSPS